MTQLIKLEQGQILVLVTKHTLSCVSQFLLALGQVLSALRQNSAPSLIIQIFQHADSTDKDLMLVNVLFSSAHPKGHTQSRFIQRNCEAAVLLIHPEVQQLSGE